MIMKRNMNKHSLRVLSGLLAVVLLAGCVFSLVSCGSGKTTTDGVLIYAHNKKDPAGTCRVVGLAEGNTDNSITVPAASPAGETVIGIDDGALSGNENLYVLYLPDTLEIIGARAFSNDYYLQYVFMPDSVRVIGKEAFYLCVYLQELTIPASLTRIEASTFWNCAYITSLTIPSSVTYIGPGAFQDCASLSRVTVSEGVLEIGDCAFGKDEALKEVTIPSTVKEIGWMAFHGCATLTDIHYNGTQNEWNKICDGALFTVGSTTIHCTDGDAIGVVKEVK